MADAESTGDAGESKQGPSAAEVEREARGMGWRPKEEFRGDPTHWADAETFVRRGREFLPILRAENSRLKDQLTAQAGEVAKVNAALQEARDAIEGLKEFQTEQRQRAAKEARAELVRKLKEARDDGDVEREAEILSGIGDIDSAVREARKEVPKKEEPKQATPEPKVDPAYVEWERDNQWIVTDGRRRALAMQIAHEMRSDRSHDHLKGREFFDAVASEVDKVFGTRAVSKVDGGRPTSESRASAASPKSRGYADLPSDAQKACDDMAKRVVGPNRAFPDDKAWRAHYAKEFFAGEEA